MLNTGAAQKLSTAINIISSGKIVLQAFEAKTFYARLRGLHAVWPLAEDEALIIAPCNAIHTLTMSSPIDVAFIDAEGVVLKAETLARYRCRRCAKAESVIEMTEGTLQRVGIHVGDVLNIRNKSKRKSSIA